MDRFDREIKLSRALRDIPKRYDIGFFSGVASLFGGSLNDAMVYICELADYLKNQDYLDPDQKDAVALGGDIATVREEHPDALEDLYNHLRSVFTRPRPRRRS